MEMRGAREEGDQWEVEQQYDCEERWERWTRVGSIVFLYIHVSNMRSLSLGSLSLGFLSRSNRNRVSTHHEDCQAYNRKAFCDTSLLILLSLLVLGLQRLTHNL
jgi:hypothetical protein